MIRLSAIAVLVLACTGCASVVPEVVKVPVLVKCVTTVPTEPTYAYKPGSYSAVFPVVRDLKGDRELMLGYQAELTAVLEACK